MPITSSVRAFLEPLEFDPEAWFAELDRLGGAEFLAEGRPEQPPMPKDEDMLDR